MSFTHTETELQAENEYPKLIRDKIPELIKRQGKEPNIRVARNKSELLTFLLSKLLEESAELQDAKTLDHQKEEIADVREVLEAIGALLGISAEEISLVKTSKADARGSFNEGIIMLEKPL